MSRRPALADADRKGQRPIAPLKDPQEAQAHLQGALEEYEETGDTKALLLALRDVAEVQGGVGQLAKRCGVNREHLYRVLSSRSKPRVDNLLAIIAGLGFRVRLEPQGIPVR
jgi:probable addiction module antidote protein